MLYVIDNDACVKGEVEGTIKLDIIVMNHWLRILLTRHCLNKKKINFSFLK